MAMFHDHNEWASSFSALGFSEFYGNRAVKRQKSSRPVLMGEEGKRQGVYGFGGDLYCPYCDELFNFILIEFDSASSDSSLAWGEVNLEEFDVDLTKCPKCGSRDMILEGL